MDGTDEIRTETRVEQLERKVADLDAMLAFLMQHGVSDVVSSVDVEGIVALSQHHEVASGDDPDKKSIEKRTDSGDSGQNGKLQIAGFGGDGKSEATELTLGGTATTDEFIVRSGDTVGYRKVKASGGGGGTTGFGGTKYFVSGIYIKNPSSDDAKLVIKGYLGTFAQGVLSSVGNEEVDIAEIPLAKHSEE